MRTHPTMFKSLAIETRSGLGRPGRSANNLIPSAVIKHQFNWVMPNGPVRATRLNLSRSPAAPQGFGWRLGRVWTQFRSLTRFPGCNAVGFSWGFSCSSLPRLILVLVAIEPNESPGPTVQNRGPTGLRGGGGGCRHSLRRSPGTRACGSTVGLRPSSCPTVRPVLAEITPYVSPGCTLQKAGSLRAAGGVLSRFACSAGLLAPIVKMRATAASTIASAMGASNRLLDCASIASTGGPTSQHLAPDERNLAASPQ